MTVELKAARLIHTGPIATAMREIDRMECEALGRKPKEALRWGLATSLSAYAIMRDGRPIGMVGVSAESMIDGRGIIWMLGTDEIYQIGKALMTYGPLLVDMWLDRFTVLENIISMDNSRGLNLLQHLGFTVDITDIRRHKNVDFIPFWIKREELPDASQKRKAAAVCRNVSYA